MLSVMILFSYKVMCSIYIIPSKSLYRAMQCLHIPYVLIIIEMVRGWRIIFPFPYIKEGGGEDDLSVKIVDLFPASLRHFDLYFLSFSFDGNFVVYMQHKTIDSVLERGEKLDSLVEKSSDLSAASQVGICIIDSDVWKLRRKDMYIVFHLPFSLSLYIYRYTL